MFEINDITDEKTLGFNFIPNVLFDVTIGFKRFATQSEEVFEHFSYKQGWMVLVAK